MVKAHLDYETGSLLELGGPNGVGVHRYAEDPETRAWGFRYRVGHGPIGQWRPGWNDPVDLLKHIRNGGIVVAHGAMFERAIWRMCKIKYKLSHWPDLPPEQQDDTMARALAMSMPAALEDIAVIMDLKEQKDMEGAKVMKLMSKPKRLKDGSLKWVDDTVSIDRNMEYCGQDVRTETEADDKIPPLTDYERQVWILDQHINDRGIPLDIPSITRAVDLVEMAKRKNSEEMNRLTGGAVKKYSEVQKILKWVQSRGFKAEAFRKEDHEDILIDAKASGDKLVQDVVNLRKAAGKTSTAKLSRMLVSACADNRSRGMFQYHGARQTGRWAGRGWQPQNPPRIDWETEEPVLTFVLDALTGHYTLNEAYERITLMGDPMVLLSKIIRLMVKAEKGNILIGADNANVEGRMNAFLAGEAWKIDAFMAFDNGTGPDLYQMTYSRSFGMPVAEVGRGPRRQVGKVMELAYGFQGGVAAFLKMCDVYLVKPESIVKPVKESTPPEMWDKIASGYAGARDKCDLPEDQWTAIKITVVNWRTAHPSIKGSWRMLEDAALYAVDNPNVEVGIYGGRARYQSDGNYLYCQLPSGRVICYANPYIDFVKTEEVNFFGVWQNVEEMLPHEVEECRAIGLPFRSRGKNTVFFWGVDGTTNQWVRSYLYGGHQCENIVQAASRCILDRQMFKVEAAGYPIVMHTHDDIIAEVRKGVGSVKHFEELMHIDDPWLVGFPQAVKGWAHERLIK